MIAHIQGKLVEKTPTEVVIDCGGVGYHINISLHTYSLRTSWRLILVLLVVGLVFEAKAVRGERRLKNDLARKLAE